MTPTTPDHKPAPATDEEIADTFSRANRVTGIGSVRALKLIARIEAERAENAKLRARVAELDEAASAFVKKLDECLPSIGAHYALQQIRTGVSYKGPNFGEELKALRAALSKPEPASR